MPDNDKPTRIRHKRHSPLFRWRMARLIWRTIRTSQGANAFKRFRNGIAGDLPAHGGDGVILAACDDFYYWHFAITLVLSIELQGEAQKVHLHLCDPTPRALDHIGRLRAALSKVDLSWTTDRCDLAAGLKHHTVYYAASRFLLAPLILEKSRRPLLCIDVDGIAVKPVWPAYEPSRGASDLVLIRRPEEAKPTMKILASAVGFNPTPRGLAFADGLGRAIADILSINPSYHVDQITIHYLLRALDPETAPSIADMPKSIWDHDFEAGSAIWTAKGWGRKESGDFQAAKSAVDRRFESLALGAAE